MLESKKYSLIEWIITIADEKIIDALQSVRSKVDQSQSPETKEILYSLSSYNEIQSRKIDLNKLKEEQNYKPTTSIELSSIAKEAKIEESIDFLLADLKSMN
jgi:hypothetical protein